MSCFGFGRVRPEPVDLQDKERVLQSTKDDLTRCEGKCREQESIIEDLKAKLKSVDIDMSSRSAETKSTKDDLTRCEGKCREQESIIEDLKAKLKSVDIDMSSRSGETILEPKPSQALTPQLSATSVPSTEMDTAKHAALKQRMLLFFKVQDKSFLEEVFHRHKDPAINCIHESTKLADALAELGLLGLSQETLHKHFSSVDLDSNLRIDLSEFLRVGALPSESERWLSTLRLPSLLARCMPTPTDGEGGISSDGSVGLRRLCDALDPETIAALAEVFCEGVTMLLQQSVAELRRGYEELDRKAAALLDADAGAGGAGAGSGKFSTFKMASGSIREYHKGMSDRIGYPNPDVSTGMRYEHTIMFGCERTFVTSNYGLSTTPRREYEIVVGEADCSEQEMMDRGGRRVRSVQPLAALRMKSVCEAARLVDAEIIAVRLQVMYTGPMFQVYNVILRRFPVEEFGAFQAGGNLYSTSIHVIVSAISKIAQAVKIPGRLKLFRGLGGLLELPDIFLHTDDKGCQGYMEYGFLSTTENEEVAVEYSGVKEGRPNAMVLEMQTDSVNRGACVCDLSQYPGEREFLWPPCSFLEPDGQPMIRITERGGVLTTVPVRICTNLKTLQVDELISQKKDMYIASARYSVEQLSRDLAEIAKEEGAHAKLANDPHKFIKKVNYSIDMFLKRIVERVREVLTSQEQISADDYLRDDKFRRISMDFLDAHNHAISSLRHYIENPAAFINGSFALPLVFSHRYYLAFLRRTLPSEEGPARKAAALKICKAMGLVESSVNEQNKLKESRLIAAAYEGNTMTIKLLVAAGASVNAACESDGWTPLICAASMGNVEAIDLLCDLGADLEAGNRTPLVSASFYGAASSIDVLLRRGANPDAADMKGASGLLLAAMKNHIEAVKLLSGRVRNIDAPDSSGKTPLMFAAEYGYTEVVKHLLDSKADPNAKSNEGAQPLHLAANFGHLETAKVLCEYMTNKDVPRNDGRTPLLCAAICSDSDTLGMLQLLLGHSAGVNTADAMGATALLLAAMKGHVHKVEYLAANGAAVDHVDSLGYTPLMLAAENGHLAAVQALCKLGAAHKKVMKGSSDTAESLASNAGHREVVNFLQTLT